jgi:hypothetical protein
MHVSNIQSTPCNKSLPASHSFTSYTAGVMIAYSAVKKAIHGLPFAEDVDLLNKCISVLSYCALKDAMAARFRDLLTRQFVDLQELLVSDGNSPQDLETEKPALPNILFSFNSGSSKLHFTARSLLNLIHRPFSGFSDTSMEATLSNRAETTMGTHLEWEWELKGSKCAENLMESDAVGETGEETDAAVKRLMLQPQGAAWTIWTTPVGT